MNQLNLDEIDNLIGTLEKKREILEHWQLFRGRKLEDKYLSDYINNISGLPSGREEEKKLIDKQLQELKIERIKFLNGNVNKENNQGSLRTGSGGTKLDFDNQRIMIGIRTFGSFNDFFELLRTKDKEIMKTSQLKSGIALIYAIARYIEEKEENENMLVSDLISYTKEFRKRFNNWRSKKGGEVKGSIIATDCIRANEILSKCNLQMKFSLSKNKEELLMVKHT